HKQRKVARAVTARKPLILPLLLLATHKSKSSSLRSPPHPPSGHLLPQAGEGLEPQRARRRGVCSLRRGSLHKHRKVTRAVTARKPLILMSGEPEQQAGHGPPCGLQKIKSSSLRSRPHPALRATFSRKREKGCSAGLPLAGEGLFGWSAAGGRRAVRLVCRWREKGCSTDVRWREKGGIGSCGSGSGRSRAGQ